MPEPIITAFKKEGTAAPSHRLAWDLDGSPERGSSFQPWRAYWPPRQDQNITDEEKMAKPWLTWKRDPSRLNDKPWYEWVNLFEGEVDQKCRGRGNTCDRESIGVRRQQCNDREPSPKPDSEGRCRYCDGDGCNVCSTVAEGG